MATFQANVRSGSKRSLKSCKAAQQSKLSLQTQLETKVWFSWFIFKTRSMRWKRGFERTWIEKQKRLERFCEIMAPDFAWKNLKFERLCCYGKDSINIAYFKLHVAVVITLVPSHSPRFKTHWLKPYIVRISIINFKSTVSVLRSIARKSKLGWKFNFKLLKLIFIIKSLTIVFT